jgi:hypothetical protein
METWRGASTPRDCEDPPRLHRMPVQEVQERSRSRATVGRSYTPWVPASCQPRPEGSHPAPARATASARRLEPAATVPISMNPGARGLTHRRSIPVAPNARRHRPVASATATLRTMSQTLSLHTTPGWDDVTGLGTPASTFPGTTTCGVSERRGACAAKVHLRSTVPVEVDLPVDRGAGHGPGRRGLAPLFGRRLAGLEPLIAGFLVAPR